MPLTHDDIEPSREWAKEIDYALRSMQIFVALNTEKYFESAWTNQEIGYALGRGIEVLCFKMCAEAPKGFIGQFQAEKATWDNVYNKIISYLRKKGEWKEIITKSLKVCESFQWSKVIWVQLNKLDNLNQVHVNNIIEGFNNNPNCYNSWFLNGTNNPGLSDLINRLSGSKYEIVKVDSKYQLVVNNAEDVEQDEGNEEVPF